MKGLKRSIGDSGSDAESDANDNSQNSNDEAEESSRINAEVDHRKSDRADLTTLDLQAVDTKVKRARLH